MYALSRPNLARAVALPARLTNGLLARSKSIGECKSKQEEDKILQHEVTALRQRFTEQLSPKKMKEAIVRMM